MRNRGNVLNAADFYACCLQCADSRFTACARSFDKYISGTHSLIDGCSRCLFCCHLRRKRRALTGTFESQSAGRCPGNGITVRISNRYNRIVECGTNMRCTGFYMFSFFSFALLFTVAILSLLQHYFLVAVFLPAIVFSVLCGYGRLFLYAVRGWAVRHDDGGLCKNRFPLNA